jgi:release factor glutamine methyltransferase
MTPIAAYDTQAISAHNLPAEARYDVYLGLGHLFSLTDNPNVFRVSAAGLALGCHLLKALQDDELCGSILDLGTGSGIQALLMRGMGATRIVATDISERAVTTAQANEIRNFGDTIVSYRAGNLFEALQTRADDRFDLIVFNPPGWRSPSETLKSKLHHSANGLDLNAMFYGDGVLVEFLAQLPNRLASGGRAIVGLNSLVGIADVLKRGNERLEGDGQKLKFKLLERVEIPLLFYTPSWQNATADLLEEFERWRDAHRSAFLKVGNRFTWFYEITEVVVVDL